MDAKLEVYDEDTGAVLETKILRAWFTWADPDGVDLCISIDGLKLGAEDSAQILIPRKALLEAIKRSPE